VSYYEPHHYLRGPDGFTLELLAAIVAAAVLLYAVSC